jgi:hypothetical protein
VNTRPSDVLYRLKRGLSGYISYLAACEMNQAFSEYVLYEPILRILTACGYTVNCEFVCPGLTRDEGGRGDQKRIDFDVTNQDSRFAIEVKWTGAKRLDVARDYAKLRSYRMSITGSRSFLCVFGRKSHIQDILLTNGSFFEIGQAVYADFGVTRYGCRIFELEEA